MSNDAARDREIVRLYLGSDEESVGAPELAERYGVSRARIYQILDAHDVPRARRQAHALGERRDRGRAGFDIDPQRAYALADDNPAVVEGRTMFPSRRVTTFEAPRFLVKGDNNIKIGGKVEKGAWAGLPVYTLTLEERATCPRSCAVWASCYGNGMPWPRRADHRDPDFIPALGAEVLTTYRQHPAGMVVRLHVLGDFYSAAYVRAWGHLMAMLPNLHVYGYTARGVETADADIALEISRLNNLYPERWVIRWSRTEPGPGHTIVVDEAVEAPEVLMCPQQVHKTETCATCALCWSPAAWDKTIAFLRHGLKKRGPSEKPPRPSPTLRADGRLGQLHAAMLKLADNRRMLVKTADELAREAGLSTSQVGNLLKLLAQRDLAECVRRGRNGPSVYRVFETPTPASERPPAPLPPIPPRKARPLPLAERAVGQKAAPVAKRAPDAPLVAPEKRSGWKGPTVKRHPKHGYIINPYVMGSADQYDIGTPEERKAALSDDERARIAAAYGVSFK